MNLKVNVGIELNQARVELTTYQKESVQRFVSNMLIGETNKPTRIKKSNYGHHPLGSRDWTKEEEIKFIDLYKQFSSRTKTQVQLLKLVGQQLGRTAHACLIRLSLIRRGKGLNPVSNVPIITKNSPINSIPTSEPPIDIHR
jgi:hypothetical protein